MSPGFASYLNAPGHKSPVHLILQGVNKGGCCHESVDDKRWLLNQNLELLPNESLEHPTTDSPWRSCGFWKQPSCSVARRNTSSFIVSGAGRCLLKQKGSCGCSLNKQQANSWHFFLEPSPGFYLLLCMGPPAPPRPATEDLAERKHMSKDLNEMEEGVLERADEERASGSRKGPPMQNQEAGVIRQKQQAAGKGPGRVSRLSECCLLG